MCVESTCRSTLEFTKLPFNKSNDVLCSHAKLPLLPVCFKWGCRSGSSFLMSVEAKSLTARKQTVFPKNHFAWVWAERGYGLRELVKIFGEIKRNYLWWSRWRSVWVWAVATCVEESREREKRNGMFWNEGGRNLEVWSSGVVWWRRKVKSEDGEKQRICV